MKKTILALVAVVILAAPAWSAVEFQVPTGGAEATTGFVGPGDGDCICQAVTLLAMDEIDTIRFYTGTGGGGAGVEEVGVYSYDGQTQYFEDVDDWDADATGYETLTNDGGFQDTAVPEGTVWVCFSADADTTGYSLAMATSSTTDELTSYHATVTCTSGNLPATISPSGSWTNNGTVVVVFGDLD
jgi:hypothetical protein